MTRSGKSRNPARLAAWHCPCPSSPQIRECGLVVTRVRQGRTSMRLVGAVLVAVAVLGLVTFLPMDAGATVESGWRGRQDPWWNWPPRQHERQVHYRQYQYQPGGPIYVVPPDARWVPGFWGWNGYQWVWVPGYWVW